MRLGSCLFLPYSTVQGPLAPRQNQGQQPSENTDNLRAAGNGLVMAECLRRHALQQKEVTVKADPQQSNVEAAVNEEESGGDGKAATAVGELYRRLSRHSTCPLIVSSDTARFEDCEAFARSSLPGHGAADVCGGAHGVLLLSKDQEEKGDSCGDNGDVEPLKKRRVLCGGTTVNVNWKERRVDASEPSWVHVPVHATGRSGQEPVVYLATEDEDVFVIVWRLTSEHACEDLYSYCTGVLKDAPPTEVGDARAVAEVALPRLQLQHLAAAGVPRCLAKAQSFDEPREMLCARILARPPPTGALRRLAQTSPLKPAMKMDSSFVLCAWHAQLDHLEVPLFVVVVRPNDWRE